MSTPTPIWFSRVRTQRPLADSGGYAELPPDLDPTEHRIIAQHWFGVSSAGGGQTVAEAM